MLATIFRFSKCRLFQSPNRNKRDGTSAASNGPQAFLPRFEPLECRRLLTLTPMVAAGVNLLYDDDAHDVTADAAQGTKGVYWLADANFAASPEGRTLAANYAVTGINHDGSMTYGTAIHWVDALNQANYAGHNNWSLPGTLPNDPGIVNNDPNVLTGPADNENHNADNFGYDCVLSPMGHLFYDEFGGALGDTLSTVPNQTNLARFTNFQPYYYWSGTAEPSRSLPADFSFGNGFLGTDKSADFEYVIPECTDSGTSDITTDLLKAYPIIDNIVVKPPPVPPPTAPLTKNADGTIHDATLNINWLADANIAATNTFGISQIRLDPATNPALDLSSININPDGSMNHDTADELIRRMNNFDNGTGKPKGYLFHSNWRVPDSLDLMEQGYYKTTGEMASSEMGELFYTELGGQAGKSVLTTDYASAGFSNFQPYYYWSGSPTNGKSDTDSDSRESFSFDSGYRSDNTHFNFMYVLPVYDSSGLIAGTSADDAIVITNALDGSVSYTVNGGAPVTLDMTQYTNLRIETGGGDDSVTFVGTASGAGANIVVNTPGGSITFTNDLNGRALLLDGSDSVKFASSEHLGSLAISDGAQAILTAGGNKVLTVSADMLNLGGDGTLDLRNNELIYNYTPAKRAADVTAVRATITSGRNGGTWDGPGITSTNAHAGNGATALGYSDDGTSTITVKYTRNGDANLDGSTGFADLVAVAQNYGITGGQTWSKGDFSYDGNTDFADLVTVAQNYGQSAAAFESAPASAPEIEAPLMPENFSAIKPIPAANRNPIPAAKPLRKLKPAVAPLKPVR